MPGQTLNLMPDDDGWRLIADTFADQVRRYDNDIAALEHFAETNRNTLPVVLEAIETAIETKDDNRAALAEELEKIHEYLGTKAGEG